MIKCNSCNACNSFFISIREFILVDMMTCKLWHALPNNIDVMVPFSSKPKNKIFFLGSNFTHRKRVRYFHSKIHSNLILLVLILNLRWRNNFGYVTQRGMIHVVHKVKTRNSYWLEFKLKVVQWFNIMGKI